LDKNFSRLPERNRLYTPGVTNGMKALLLFAALLGASCGARAVMGPAGSPGRTMTGEAMPEFLPGPWVHGPPQRLADLRGRVVLIHFWTFG
jgi:hypothetical protein